MSQIDETLSTGRDAEGFKICLLTRAVERRRFNAIKAVAPAMTNQLYTISIKSRKQIENINALVSPKHCELLPLFTAGLQKSKHEIVLCGIEAIRMGFEKFPDRKIPKVAGLNRITTPSEVTHFRQPTVTQWPHLGKGTGVACRLHITSERGLNMPLKRKQPCNS